MAKYKPIESKIYKGWYEIPGFSKYLANKDGFIKVKKTGYITKGGNAGNYLKVGIYKDGHSKHSLYYVHDLICRAFYGLPDKNIKNPVVLHADDNKFNNKASNLSWGSQSQNIKDVWVRGLRKSNKYSYENYKEKEDLYILSFNQLGSQSQIALKPSTNDIEQTFSDESIDCIPEYIRCFKEPLEALKYTIGLENKKEVYLYKVNLNNSLTILDEFKLAEEKFVEDSILTTECWILENCSASFERIINLKNIEYSFEDYNPYGNENFIKKIKVVKNGIL